MSAEQVRKVPLGFIAVSLVLLFNGILGLWIGITRLIFDFDLTFGPSLIVWGIASICASLGIYSLKQWAWYLAVGQGIFAILMYFVFPFYIMQIPLVVVLLPYLFLRRDVFLGRANAKIMTWLRANKFFLSAIVIWVSIFIVLKPLAMQSFASIVNDGIGQQTGNSGPLRVVVTASKQSDLVSDEDFYSLSISFQSEESISVVHISVHSEQGVCNMWQPTSGWKMPYQGYWQPAQVDVAGVYTNQIRWTIQTSGVRDNDFEADYVVPEGSNFSWTVETEAERLIPIWWLGLEVGALSIIIAWGLMRHKA